MKKIVLFISFVFISVMIPIYSVAASGDTIDLHKMYFTQVAAKTSAERTKILEAGFGIDAVFSDYVYGVTSGKTLSELRKKGFEIVEFFEDSGRDFPSEDAAYHNYDETKELMFALAEQYSDIATVFSIGKSVENRDIWCLRITGDVKNAGNVPLKPGTVFMGMHHSREHLTNELALMVAQYLLENYGSNGDITAMVESRDIYFIPMVNPDGGEYDISTGSYQYWRKNRSRNSDGTYGVDLNRNYGYRWNTGGASHTPSSDTYHGPSAFSEPETTAVKNFVEDHPNIKILLTLHSYSELILYPWGHTDNPIDNQQDRAVFTTMAQTMARWNGYTPQQSSDLYVTSGDTTDWAYGELGIFAFTFELSPKSGWFGGGFYPGASAIDKAFDDNIDPCLYLISISDDPYKVTSRNYKYLHSNSLYMGL